MARIVFAWLTDRRYGIGIAAGSCPFRDEPSTPAGYRTTGKANPGSKGSMADSHAHALGKVPEVTLAFWIIKIAATTLGETGGDAVTMQLHMGYLVGSLIFVGLFVVAVTAQVAAKSFHSFLYWAVIVATTTAGTTIADFADRSLGIGYTGGTAILAVLLMLTLGLWYRVMGSVAVHTITSPKVEIFYWAVILFSQTLGTALGDWMADAARLGFEGGALVFLGALMVVAVLYFTTGISRTLLFWSAFILTRPLGATVGDVLDKPIAQGGFALDRIDASAILAAFMLVCMLIFRQREGRQPGILK